ncbi:PREDICTED: INO80 complex subunit D [Thamnophis sirtalis]|uniref:INO80 complex subunit D n=1 Tax=Thamnophis sirtalis TaxID=35019 RepID=A0A6I9XUZ6_9SAUR|nr:PREDICTED: INO80 complex subunit D [Thamnophis sirtalis]
MYEGKHIHFSEVDNKPLCSYSPKLCKQRRLNGYAFCIRHVLEDKTAPFKQCEYVAKYNSQRCTNPIPKSEDRRYCNSHLQVLGFLPKKERKKKNDPTEEVKVRHQMDSIAFSLTVPPLALKMSNGLVGMSLSPPGARLPLHYLEAELEDPFAFNEEDEELKKGTAVKKKLQSKLAQNRQRQKETEIQKVRQEHFSPAPAPSQQPPLQPQQHAHLSPLPTSLKPAVHPQGLVCKSPQPQNTSLPMQGGAPTTHAIAQARQSANKRPLPLLHPTKVHAPDPPRADRILMKATAFSPYSFCRSRLQRLVKLCTQKHQLDADLFPHLGLDWSEDSGEELEELDQTSPYQVAWSIREALRYERNEPDDDYASGRRTRISQLCTYFQQKYKHLCRLERAETQQRKCQHTFRKALLRAANREPEYAGQLIRELHRASRPRTSSSQVKQRDASPCGGTTKGEPCTNKALPFTKHCFQRILFIVPLFICACLKVYVRERLILYFLAFCFDEGKNGDLLPTTEEAEELERALQAVTSLECLSTIGVLTQTDGVPVQELSDRGIGVFSPGAESSGIQSLSREVNADLGELLNGRIVHDDNFSGLDLDENLLHSATLSNPSTPLAGQIQGQFSAPANVGLTSATLISQSALGERAFPGQFQGLHDGSHASQRPHPAQLLSKADDLITSRQQYSSDHSHSSPHGSHYDSEHVPSPYSDHLRSPSSTSYSSDNLAATFSTEMPIIAQHLLPSQLEVPLSGVVNPRTHWGSLPVNLGDPSPFSNLLGADGHLLSTSLSTPPTTSHSETTQPAFATVTPNSSSVLPGLPQTSFSGMGAASSELMASTSPKQQLPQFSAAFGHQLSSHSGIPKDLQPSHSSIAPPTGFAVTGATATSTNNASAPFTTSS